MRVGEVIGLGRNDIGQPEGCLTVRRAKFGASRELPLHQTTMDALATYAGVRDEHWPTATSHSCNGNVD